MDNEIIQLLKSSNPKERASGINKLAVSGHPNALKTLANFSENRAEQAIAKIKEKEGVN